MLNGSSTQPSLQKVTSEASPFWVTRQERFVRLRSTNQSSPGAMENARLLRPKRGPRNDGRCEERRLRRSNLMYTQDCLRPKTTGLISRPLSRALARPLARPRGLAILTKPRDLEGGLAILTKPRDLEGGLATLPKPRDLEGGLAAVAMSRGIEGDLGTALAPPAKAGVTMS